jgi:hypothetical protein
MNTNPHWIPAWINVDAIAPPELQTDIAETIDRIKALIPPMQEAVDHARDLLARAQEVEHAATGQLDPAADSDVHDGASALVSR